MDKEGSQGRKQYLRFPAILHIRTFKMSLIAFIFDDLNVQLCKR
jgi:hypothetical protein